VPGKSQKKPVIQKKIAKTAAIDSDDDDARISSENKGKPTRLSEQKAPSESKRKVVIKKKQQRAETDGIDSDDWRDETYDDAGCDSKDKDKEKGPVLKKDFQGDSVATEKAPSRDETKTETKNETKRTDSDSDDNDTQNTKHETGSAKGESASSAPKLYEPPQESKPKKSLRTPNGSAKSDKLVPGQILSEMYKMPIVIPGLETEEFEDPGSESD
jgi:hypothetical protein